MLIYFVECFIMGFALGLSWASFGIVARCICCSELGQRKELVQIKTVWAYRNTPAT